MLHLLRVEWLKLKNYRTFWILLAITIVSIPGLNYVVFDVLKNSFPKGKGLVKTVVGSPFAFPDVWQTVSYNSAPFLLILPAILIITLTTNEFTFRTHRQNIIDGWSRKQFVTVKLFELAVLAVICTLVVGITTLLFGLVANSRPPGQALWQDSRFVFFYFVQCLSYSTIAFLLALLIRRAGLSIGAFLIYMLGEQIIVGIFRNVYKETAVNYLPEEVTDQLIPQPYLKKLTQTAADAADWEHHLPIYLLIALLYLIIYYVVTTWRFTKSDLR
jgi:ABC-2 type transport system permease protein